MNGQTSPQGLARQGRRLSNRGRIIAGAVGAGFLVLIGLSGNGPKKDAQAAVQDDHGGSSFGLADEVSGQRSTGITPKATPNATPLPSPFATPAPNPAPAPSPTPDEEKKRLKDAYFASLNARSGVQTQGFQQMLQDQPRRLTPQELAALRRADPNNLGNLNAVRAYQEDQVPVAPAIPAYGPQGGAPGGNAGSALSRYNGNANRWAINSSVQQPPTPYVIEPGWTIQAALESPINSELPGMITARVTRDVYDTPTGTYLLIPQGSQLVGEYDRKIEYGQSRVFVAWQRINFPGGTWLDIGAMPGADGEGTSGLHDLTDTHFFRLFGHAILMSGITAGFAISQPQYGYGNGNGVNASQALSESLGQNLGNVMSQLFNKDVNVSPTLRIRAAFPLTVFVNKDLVFDHPYHLANYDANN